MHGLKFNNSIFCPFIGEISDICIFRRWYWKFNILVILHLCVHVCKHAFGMHACVCCPCVCRCSCAFKCLWRTVLRPQRICHVFLEKLSLFPEGLAMQGGQHTKKPFFSAHHFLYVVKIQTMLVWHTFSSLSISPRIVVMFYTCQISTLNLL